MRIFLLLLFLSFNLNAANYLICESDNQSLNIKLDNQKIYVQNQTDDFKNYTSFITKWNKEFIQTEKEIEYINNAYDNCLIFNASINDLLHLTPSTDLKNLCKDVENIGRVAKRLEIIKINRLTGNLIFDTGRSRYDPITKKHRQKTNFECKLQEKTLF